MAPKVLERRSIFRWLISTSVYRFLNTVEERLKYSTQFGFKPSPHMKRPWMFLRKGDP